jgi:hypothetical protein
MAAAVSMCLNPGYSPPSAVCPPLVDARPEKGQAVEASCVVRGEQALSVCEAQQEPESCEVLT